VLRHAAAISRLLPAATCRQGAAPCRTGPGAASLPSFGAPNRRQRVKGAQRRSGPLTRGPLPPTLCGVVPEHTSGTTAQRRAPSSSSFPSHQCPTGGTPPTILLHAEQAAILSFHGGLTERVHWALTIALLRRAGVTNIAEVLRTHAGRPRAAATLVLGHQLE
jgi:hypothetical protein